MEPKLITLGKFTGPKPISVGTFTGPKPISVGTFTGPKPISVGTFTGPKPISVGTGLGGSNTIIDGTFTLPPVRFKQGKTIGGICVIAEGIGIFGITMLGIVGTVGKVISYVAAGV